ncbi:MAG: response regulator [Chloroflexales bacterium]|nr:response regulator [Chloroflexales bacterium]
MSPSYNFIIAEDDDAIRAVIARIVVQTYSRVSISAVKDGSEALIIFGQRGADFVITNYDMPIMNGLDLIRALRAREITVPILMVSSDALVEQQALAAGVSTFITKPFRVAQLTQALTNSLAP